MSHSLTHFDKATFTCSLIAGLEPHSALPVALPMVFTDHCDLLPKGLRGIKILAHTAVTFLNFVLSGLEIGFFNNYLSPQNPTAVMMIAIAPHTTSSSSSSSSFYITSPCMAKGMEGEVMMAIFTSLYRYLHCYGYIYITLHG